MLLVQAVYRAVKPGPIYADRSYFGVLRVGKQAGSPMGTVSIRSCTARIAPRLELPRKDGQSTGRLATTYYHQFGPAGMVMEKFNWFKDGFPLKSN